MCIFLNSSYSKPVEMLINFMNCFFFNKEGVGSVILVAIGFPFLFIRVTALVFLVFLLQKRTDPSFFLIFFNF